MVGGNGWVVALPAPGGVLQIFVRNGGQPPRSHTKPGQPGWRQPPHQVGNHPDPFTGLGV